MKELKEIKLFKRLEKLDKDFASQLKKIANKIKELINKKTTINFPNYTNHDMNHSFKLMDTIHELIKDNKKDFNALEIALMIYSCLFHDIGMAISDKDIEKIKDNTSKYLYGQDFNEVIKNNFDNEDLALQEIIRISHGKIAYDLITSKYEDEFRLPEYENISFAQSLAEICLSHTKDRSYVEELESNSTKGEYEYNTQFLSILLRLADILDIDSTRTPLALYEAIDLNDFSDGEWQKNFTIDNIKKIFKSNDLKEIKLEGTCKDIKIHRKLLSYIKWIENELRLAVDLTSNMDKKYHIKLNTEVKNKIKPIGYTIPDLKLNIDYHAVTNLLMGEAIYGSKDLGLRELLQNSIDAIMVKKDKLEMENHPSKDSYEPTINIDIDKENNKVIISDNGMGMNEYIIKNYFLNVGKSYYKSKDFLNYKHSYNPIGNFGIGFLSCFMLSDEVQVITKHFDSNKKYTIELEKNSEYIAFNEDIDNSSKSGTEIVLNLNTFTNVFNKINDLNAELKNFIFKYILIENFVLSINNKKLSNNTKNETETENLYTINLSNYMDGIDGFITINKSPFYNNTINDDVENSISSYYFDGVNLTKFNSFDTFDITQTINNYQIQYIKIPLIKDMETGDKIDAIVMADPWNLKELIEEEYLEEYICIFFNKEYSILHHDNIVFLGNEIAEGNHEYIESTILEPLIEEFKHTYINIMLVEEKNILFNDNELLLEFRKKKAHTSPHHKTSYRTFIKNIALLHQLDFNLIELVYINNIQLNIKTNFIKNDISRKGILKESENDLNYALGKIIHLFTLKNFDLEEDERFLLNNFIHEFYSEKSFLLKDNYNRG
ncbi:HD domain-containing protein [Poseidonibacter lekithochrous]|uniref:HD domain-containing protein n=2 Tax=Pseudomonadati TaxID=3379134 RepID=UPI000D366C31|nr:ATP-binding protein [Poseidonibacter lekithochrous]